ncbi:MAG: hypothetical protein IJA61_04015 [Clostridia bacterium]|nr:hypothetical protein [Clostridia bacterium]
MGKQLKLLNFYKMISNITNNLVGAFVPLIIYNATGSLFYGVLYLVCVHVVRGATVCFLHKQIEKSPEKFLILRLLTIIAGVVSLAILDNLFVVGFLVASCAFGVDSAFRYYSNEILLNYSSGNAADSKNLGVTRVFEQMGIFAGIILGGVLLDINQIVVYVVAVVVYIIAVLPLIVYAIKNRKSSTHNKEMVSNATMELSKKSNKVLKYIVVSLLFCYAIAYVSYASIDLTINTLNLNLAVEGGISYSFASVFVAVYNGAYLIGNIIVDKVDRKMDLLVVVRFVCLIMAGCVILLHFVSIPAVIIAIVCVIGLIYPFVTVFILQRLLAKTRIIGISNKGIMIREVASDFTYAFNELIMLLICGVGLSLRWFYIVIALWLIFASFIIPKIEERTRKSLVDFIENNEIGNAAPIDKD